MEITRQSNGSTISYPSNQATSGAQPAKIRQVKQYSWDNPLAIGPKKLLVSSVLGAATGTMLEICAAKGLAALPPVAAALEYRAVSFVFNTAHVGSLALATLLGAAIGTCALIEYKIFKNKPAPSEPGMYETFSELPDDIWREIATQLPFKDQRVLRGVSRQFCENFENKKMISSSGLNIVKAQAELRRVKDANEPAAVVAEAERRELSATSQHKLENWYTEASIHHYHGERSFSTLRGLIWPQNYFDLPVMNWSCERPMDSFWGIGPLDYFDTEKDYTAPLMRGFDETSRPFIAALICVENMTTSSVDETANTVEPSDAIDQIVLYQLSHEDFSEKRPMHWRAAFKGENLAKLESKLVNESNGQYSRSLFGQLRQGFLFENNAIKESLRVLLSGGTFEEVDGTTLRLFRSMDEVRAHRDRNSKP